MSELMTPIPFRDLMNWITTEYRAEGSVFGVHRPYRAGVKKLPIFGETIETPFRSRRRSQHPAGPEHHRRLLCRRPVL
ncbi:MAG: hypothetical protein V8R55_07290 [Dysosmobacter sp.]